MWLLQLFRTFKSLIIQSLDDPRNACLAELVSMVYTGLFRHRKPCAKVARTSTTGGLLVPRQGSDVCCHTGGINGESTCTLNHCKSPSVGVRCLVLRWPISASDSKPGVVNDGLQGFLADEALESL